SPGWRHFRLLFLFISGKKLWQNILGGHWSRFRSKICSPESPQARTTMWSSRRIRKPLFQRRRPAHHRNSIIRHQEKIMAAKLNKSGFDYAKKLVASGKVVVDDRDAWSEHQPSTQEENEFIQQRGFYEYSKWHLGIDNEQPVNSKRHYKFPYGDFKKAHRCGIITAEARAGQYKY